MTYEAILPELVNDQLNRPCFDEGCPCGRKHTTMQAARNCGQKRFGWGVWEARGAVISSDRVIHYHCGRTYNLKTKELSPPVGPYPTEKADASMIEDLHQSIETSDRPFWRLGDLIAVIPHGNETIYVNTTTGVWALIGAGDPIGGETVTMTVDGMILSNDGGSLVVYTDGAIEKLRTEPLKAYYAVQEVIGGWEILGEDTDVNRLRSSVQKKLQNRHGGLWEAVFGGVKYPTNSQLLRYKSSPLKNDVPY